MPYYCAIVSCEMSFDRYSDIKKVLQNCDTGASSCPCFPALSFCTCVGGTGLCVCPVARYMAWTHNIRSCSSSLKQNIKPINKLVPQTIKLLIIRFANAKIHGRLVQLFNTSLSMRKIWGSTPGKVKLDTISPTARHCYVSSELCWSGAKQRRLALLLAERLG